MSITNDSDNFIIITYAHDKSRNSIFDQPPISHHLPSFFSKGTSHSCRPFLYLARNAREQTLEFRDLPIFSRNKKKKRYTTLCWNIIFWCGSNGAEISEEIHIYSITHSYWHKSVQSDGCCTVDRTRFFKFWRMRAMRSYPRLIFMQRAFVYFFETIFLLPQSILGSTITWIRYGRNLRLC